MSPRHKRWPRKDVFPRYPKTDGIRDIRLLTRIVAGMSFAESLALLTALLQPQTRLWLAGAILWRVFQQLDNLSSSEIDGAIERLAGCSPRYIRRAREVYAKTTRASTEDRRQG